MSIDNIAAIVCSHVFSREKPILWAVRDVPGAPDESGWQFLCNSGVAETEPRVLSIRQVLELEPSLARFINAAPGTSVQRTAVGSPWTVSVAPPE
jgi:hypothetical protein